MKKWKFHWYGMLIDGSTLGEKALAIALLSSVLIATGLLLRASL
jgi:hypothetical protein